MKKQNWKELVDATMRNFGRESVMAFLHEVGLNGKLTNEKLEESKFWENQTAAVMSNIWEIPEQFRPSGRGILRRLNQVQ